MTSQLEHRIIQYLTNSMSAEERAVFEHDLINNVQLKKEFVSYKSIWEMTECLNYDRTSSDFHWENFESKISNKTNSHSSKLSFVKIAASVVIIAVISIILWNFLSDGNKYTSADFVKNYQLDDQSKVILNPHSTLSFSDDFNKNSREVTLSGEAYFDVVANDKKFVVHTSVGDVIVHGTQFKVSIDEKDSLLVIDLFDGQLSYFQNNKEYTLLTGDLLISSKNTVNRSRSDISINDDFVICKNTSLADILTQINLVYGVDHHIKSKLLNDVYTLSFPKNNTNKCIVILNQVSGNKFALIDNSIVFK